MRKVEGLKAEGRGLKSQSSTIEKSFSALFLSPLGVSTPILHRKGRGRTCIFYVFFFTYFIIILCTKTAYKNER